MIHHTTSTAGQAGKRTGQKLRALLAASAGLCLWAGQALATIDNTVVANGTSMGQPVTATATEKVDVVNQVDTLQITKQGTLNDGGDGEANVGDTITYTFDITNTGNVTLTNVTLQDNKVSASALVLQNDVAPFGDSTNASPTGWSVLAPGDSLHATATYVLTQADIDASRVQNTASASATTVPGQQVSATDTVDTRFNITSSLSLEKTASLDLGVNGQANVGDVISYQFKVTNTGTGTLSNVSVSDPLVNFASLPGRASVVALLEGVSTGADPIMTASVERLPQPAGQPYRWFASATQVAPLDVPQLPAAIHARRKLVSLAEHQGPLAAGDTVGIYVDITNTGDVPLTSISVDQPGATSFGDRMDILAPNSTDSASIIFTRVLDAADIASGEITAPATVTARARGRAVSTVDEAPLQLADAVPLQDLSTATITPGNVPTLAPGASTIFTASYQLTQADIDAGHVANTADATANDPFGDTVTSTDSVDTPVLRAPDMAMLKTSSLNLGSDGVASVGDIITYQFTVSNIGNTTLNAVTVADPLPGVVLSAAPVNGLLPGASHVFTGTYALKQTDIDAGQVQNQATASATAPGNPAPLTDLSDPADLAGDAPTITTLPAAPKIALVKKVSSITDTNANAMNDAGDVVNYAFTVSNPGNVTLGKIYVADRDPAVVETPAAPTTVSLAPGAVDATTFTGTYVLTQADVDRGYYDNTADVFGTAPDNTIVQDESDPLVPTANAPTRQVLAAAPRIALLKTVGSVNDVNNNGITDLNDIITFNFAVSNPGNVTLTNVTVTDNNAVMTGGPISLAPGATDTTTFHATHVVSAQDMLDGRVSNQATATGRAPAGNTVTDASDPANVNGNNPTITAVTVRPGIAVVKRVTGFTNTNGNGTVDAGDTIEYAFDVTNTGNVPLSGVTITDPLAPVTGGPLSLLQPGATDSTTFRASYVMTPADITAGQVVNQATARGLAPNGAPVTDLSDNDTLAQNDPTITSIANAPAMGVVKTITGVTDANNNTVTDAGDVVHYAFAISNLGNVPLANVTVTDPNGVVAGGPLASLPVGAVDNATFTATHVLTVADINAGSVSNQATAAATSSLGPVTDLSDNNSPLENDATVLPITQVPGLAVVLTVVSITDTNHNGRTDAGDVVNYGITLSNSGNVTLTNVTVNSGNVVIQGGPLSSLAPGATNTTTFTGRHVVTVADSEAEQIVAQVQGVGVAPGGASVSDMSDDDTLTQNDPTVTPVSAPLPVLTKTAARSEIRRGERVAYTITAASLRTGPYDIADIMPPGFKFVAGSATANGVAVVPQQSGSTLVFPALPPDATGMITVKLTLLSSTTLSTGDFINKARLHLSANGDLLADAQAKVTIKEEHVFDCGEVIGRVFDDLNANGYADDGEPGLPGVRVATVKGLLVTTDKQGRFHVACADVPDASIGSNFLMKLDTRTLPSGYKLTSENPRDVRLTRGKVTKLNFAATRKRNVELALTRDAFDGNGTTLKPRFASGVDRLVSLLGKGNGTLSIVYRCTQAAPIVGQRLDAVQELVQARWTQQGGNKPLKITTRVECGGNLND